MSHPVPSRKSRCGEITSGPAAGKTAGQGSSRRGNSATDFSGREIYLYLYCIFGETIVQCPVLRRRHLAFLKKVWNQNGKTTTKELRAKG